MRWIRFLWALPNTLVGLALVPFVLAAGGRGRVVDGVLEVHGALAAYLLTRCVPFEGGAVAITFGHVVFGRDAPCLKASRAHERVHVRQCEVWGPAFIPAYVAASLWGLITGQGVYAGNRFERDAVRRSEHEADAGFRGMSWRTNAARRDGVGR